MESVPLYYPSGDGPIRQGELLSSVKQICPKPGCDLKAEISAFVQEHSYAIVLSQDCDLDRDFRIRERIKEEPTKKDKLEPKLLDQILFCEVELVNETNSAGEGEGSSAWERIVKNNDFRFHFLQKVEKEEDATKEGINAFIVSFSRYFTVSANDLMIRLEKGETQRRCRMESPYFEHLADRFSHYVARIGLPKDHSVDGVLKKK